MPTYVYECSQCHQVFERDQRITEEPIRDCDCGSQGTVKRLIQPIAVMFKGSGFHINDYAGKPATESKPAETAVPEAAPTPVAPAQAATESSA
jgi:putative FmdB family regulatory protein